MRALGIALWIIVGLATAARRAMADEGPANVHMVDIRSLRGCTDVEAIVVMAEHGQWIFCGRHARERFRGVHATDPLLADLLTHRLLQAEGRRAG